MEAETTGGPQAVTKYLEEKGVAFEVIEHDERFTAAAEARAAGVEPRDAAKGVVLRDDEGYVLAVIPASERLDLKRVREALEPRTELRLATEKEMAEDFPAFEVGALPPVGPVLPAAEVIDRGVVEHERILCTAGDHRHSLALDPNDLVRLTGARLADICEQ